MTHREQIIAMLEDAGLDFGYSDGDSIIKGCTRFRFYANGRLKQISREGGDDDERY